MALRPYQRDLVSRVHDAWINGVDRPLVVLPTGGGKTVVGSEVATVAVEAGRSVTWFAHRKELVEQARRRLPAKVKVHTIQSFIGKPPPESDLIILDEAHHAVAQTWERLTLGDRRILGLTATPERGDRIGLRRVFQKMILGPSVRRLVALGYLCGVETIAPPSQSGSLALDPVQAWERYCKDRQGFIFCQTISDAELFSRRLPNAKAVHGGTPRRDREQVIRDFRAGNIQTICNVYVLTEGFDAPEASVCVLARGAGSRSLFLQMVGRAMRPAPGKRSALLVDLRGVCHEHGLPEDDYDWNFEGTARKSDRIAIRTCPTCYAVSPIADWKNGQCPTCGSIHEAKKTDRSAKVIEKKLTRVRKPAEYSRTERMEFLLHKLKIAQSRGYKLGWAKIQYKNFFGEWPPRGWTT